MQAASFEAAGFGTLPDEPDKVANENETADVIETAPTSSKVRFDKGASGVTMVRYEACEYPAGLFTVSFHRAAQSKTGQPLPYCCLDAMQQCRLPWNGPLTTFDWVRFRNNVPTKGLPPPSAPLCRSSPAKVILWVDELDRLELSRRSPLAVEELVRSIIR